MNIFKKIWSKSEQLPDSELDSGRHNFISYCCLSWFLGLYVYQAYFWLAHPYEAVPSIGFLVLFYISYPPKNLLFNLVFHLSGPGSTSSF